MVLRRQRVEGSLVDDHRALGRARGHVRGEPVRQFRDLVAGVRVGVGERHRVDRAALHQRVDLRGRHGLKRRAEDLHRLADAAAGADAQALPSLELLRRLAGPHELVLRQQGRRIADGVPRRHVGLQRRVLEKLVPD